MGWGHLRDGTAKLDEKDLHVQKRMNSARDVYRGHSKPWEAAGMARLVSSLGERKLNSSRSRRSPWVG